jgi:DtxR family Mn-dependent transcriptional regulator
MPNSKINNLYGETGLTSNMEDYMESIAILAQNNKIVRVKDIAKSLNIKMPSVTAALNKLKELKLIDYEKYGYVELTAKGREAAENVCRKHLCLKDFFTTVLSVDNNSADTDACKVEHTLQPKTCTQIHKFLEFYKEEKKQNKDWIKRIEAILK